MTCPSCGDTECQRRVGEIYNRAIIVYHCEACNHLYVLEKCEPTNGEEE